MLEAEASAYLYKEQVQYSRGDIKKLDERY